MDGTGQDQGRAKLGAWTICPNLNNVQFHCAFIGIFQQFVLIFSYLLYFLPIRQSVCNDPFLKHMKKIKIHYKISLSFSDSFKCVSLLPLINLINVQNYGQHYFSTENAASPIRPYSPREELSIRHGGHIEWETVFLSCPKRSAIVKDRMPYSKF